MEKFKEMSLFDLNTLVLDLTGIEGNYNGNHYGGGGIIAFNEQNSIELQVRIFEAEYKNMLDMVEPVLVDIRKYFPDISMVFNSDLSIYGKMKSDKIIVEGMLESKDVIYQQESVEKLSINYKLSKKNVDLNSIKIKKNNANLEGYVRYNVTKNDLRFKGDLSRLSLEDINLYDSLNMGLKGELYGEFSGKGTLNNFSSRIQLKVLNSHIKTQKIQRLKYNYL